MNTDISASEVAAILGLSPWQTPMDVWVRKSGIVEDTSSNATRRGHMLERAIIDRWWAELPTADKSRQGCVIGPTLQDEPIRRSDVPWICARPDALIKDLYPAVPPGWRAVMDAKSARSLSEDYGWSITLDGVPAHYAAQLAWQCAAAMVHVAHLAAYGTQRDEWRTYRLTISDAHQRTIIAAVADWRERHLLTGTPPTADGTDAWSEHIRRLYPGRTQMPDMVATAQDRALARDLARVRARIAELSREAKALEQALQLRMGDAHVLRDGEEVIATWRPRKGTRRIDADALRRDLPEIAQKYTTTGEEGRTFKLNIEEEP